MYVLMIPISIVQYIVSSLRMGSELFDLVVFAIRNLGSGPMSCSRFADL
jgi:hypothetical protein